MMIPLWKAHDRLPIRWMNIFS